MIGLPSFAFLVVCSIAISVGFTGWRVTRRGGRGLVVLSFSQAVWVAALFLLEIGDLSWAEHFLPSGMLLAGAFVHAAADMERRKNKRIVHIAYALSGAVAVLGFVAPRLLYGPGARGMGPVFLPLAAASIVATLMVKAWLFGLVRSASTPRERSRRLALFVANVSGALGGGAAITLHITGLASASVAAPFMVLSTLMAAFATWGTEEGRGRQLLLEGGVEGAVSAGLALVPVAVLLAAASSSTSTASAIVLAVIVFLPFEAVRRFLSERVTGALFARPLGVGALVQEVERQESRADQAERLAEIGRLAGGVAHEIRNPLGVILAELKLLERAGADPESLQAIRGQVARAGTFVDELLQYATPRPLACEEVGVSSAITHGVSDACRALQVDASSVSVTGPQVFIEADAAAVRDVVRNLVGNALAAIDGRTGAAVRVIAMESAGFVEISVDDDGPGVPPAIVPNLFTPFVTGRGRDAKHPGTGLGLAICRRLVERHGGTLVHERPATGGARFVSRWPKKPGVPA